MKFSLACGLAFILVLVLHGCAKNDASRPSSEDESWPVIPCLNKSLSRGVIAYYPFRSGSLRDESGNGHDLVNGTTAAPAADRQGNAACAFGFYNLVRRDEMLTLTQTGFLDRQAAFSVSLWYYAEDSSRDPRLYETLISQDTGFDCPDRMGNWSLGLYDGRSPVFAMYTSVWDMANAGGALPYPYPWTTNKWRHVVATYDRNADHEMRIYVNGVLQASANGITDCSPQPLISRRGPLMLGHLFNGRIDDVIIYNRVLPPAEVRELSTSEPCCVVVAP